jgi:hypothetical protein
LKFLKKMKKVLFFMLFLMILGTASVKAQVRIGGNGVPHGAAVLDLNTDDANNGTKTLALPRVRLTSITDKMGNAALLNGMLVYNTAGGTLSEGVYYWDGSQWVKPNSTAYAGSTSVTLSGNSFQRAALTGDGTRERMWCNTRTCWYGNARQFRNLPGHIAIRAICW